MADPLNQSSCNLCEANGWRTDMARLAPLKSENGFAQTKSENLWSPSGTPGHAPGLPALVAGEAGRC